MTIADFYRGGMILFGLDAAYSYEEHLARFISHRVRRYMSGNRLYFLMLDEFNRKRADGQYSRDDFHIYPGDPLVCIPDAPEMLWLKGKKLHCLRMQALKCLRRSQRK